MIPNEQTAVTAWAAAIADCEAKALALRSSLDALTAATPMQAGAWVAAMTAPETARGLGALHILGDGFAAWMRQHTQELTAAIESNAPAELPFFADGMAAGMARAAISCPCGVCLFCVDKARFGTLPGRDGLEAQMVRHFRKGMAVPASRRLTIARG